MTTATNVDFGSGAVAGDMPETGIFGRSVPGGERISLLVA
jgi:hypothetical protein